jgi:hypothetical protein
MVGLYYSLVCLLVAGYICFPISTSLCVYTAREREREFVALMNQVLFVARRIIELLLADCVRQPSGRNNKSRDIRLSVQLFFFFFFLAKVAKS